jgi:hypothetical protein
MCGSGRTNESSGSARAPEHFTLAFDECLLRYASKVSSPKDKLSRLFLLPASCTLHLGAQRRCRDVRAIECNEDFIDDSRDTI